MEINKIVKEIFLILLVSLIIGVSFGWANKNLTVTLEMTLIFLAILLINLYAKRFFAYNLETDISIKAWAMEKFGFKHSQRFRNPLKMLWLPIVTALATTGRFIWLPLIEFDITPRPERVSKRHGLYRFTEVTEWHIALIAVAGIFANIVAGILVYFAGFSGSDTFAKWSIYYSLWLLLPFSSLDGTKILMGNRYLWFTLTIVLLSIFVWSLTIF